jgi:signal transduction histidine kinase
LTKPGSGEMMGSVILLKFVHRVLNLWLCFAVIASASAADLDQDLPGRKLSSLDKLQKTVGDRGCAAQSFHVEGVVCGIVNGRKSVALQDDSATVLLELPGLDSAIKIGDRLAIEGDECTLVRTHFGIRIGTEVINNDGEHRRVLKSGQIFLENGRQPFRVEWFNAAAFAVLAVQYQGPGVQRQPIPAAALWRRDAGQTNFQPGLHYAAYLQPDIQPQSTNFLANGWQALPDFARLKVNAEGVATNLDARFRARNSYTALVFSGYLEIPKSGVYTFYLESDDGSRLYVGDPSARRKMTTSSGQSPPTIRTWEQAVGAPAFQWSELSGAVNFAAAGDEETQLELSTGRGMMQVMVLGNPPDSIPALLHQRIEAVGICETSPDAGALMVVPGWDAIKVSSSTNATALLSTNVVLTSAGQVRRLKPDQAQRAIPTKIKGVVIAENWDSLVLQDATGGVFVHWNSDTIANRPHVGELWEIEGKTDPGDFSPVVFASKAKFLQNVPLPEPIRPTWDQLMNGSLDAEYVEIRGVVTGISKYEMTLLTPDGKVTVEGNNERPLPELPASASASTLVGSVVRMRGCFTADWDWQTSQVNGGRFELYPAMIEVEESAPPEPFAMPATKAADLLRFNARASALQRTKVSGQIIYARPGEYFLLDDQTGIRVHAAAAESLRAGDLIEAVGFPRLGGPSPDLQCAQIKVTGRAALPEPVLVAETNLMDRLHDSTLVRMEATLISDTVHQDKRVLELQSGAQRFAAILKSDPRTWSMYLPGSRLRLTGVYASEETEPAGGELYPFEILLNNAAGITLLQQPSWWTVQRAVTIAAALASVLGIAFIWITLLHRKVEQRTAQLQQEIETRQRVEQYRMVEQERTRVARDLHDELGAGLTELGILGELGNNAAIPPDEKNRYLQQLTGLTRNLVAGLDEIVWATNPHYDSLASMVTYYSFFADRFLKLAGIACRLRVPENFPEYPVNSQIRHGVFLAFKEALNNVVRHAQATEVELKIQTDGDDLVISIRDNGRGMAPGVAAAPGTDGLSGMRERLQQFRGSCRITSNPGEGAIVEFRLPLIQPAAAMNLKPS